MPSMISASPTSCISPSTIMIASLVQATTMSIVDCLRSAKVGLATSLPSM